MNKQDALYQYALRLGDNALIQSCRLGEWCSYAPLLEEDLALTNFALDMLGRAQAYLKYAGELEGRGKTEDDLAYRRSERQYYNNLLAEQPNGDFANTIVRQFFLSVFEYYFFAMLTHSKDETIAAIAAKTLKEVKYHRSHSEDWVMRLGLGTEESHNRMQAAIDNLWMFTGELFETDEIDAYLIEQGIAADVKQIAPKWNNYVDMVLHEADLTHPGADTYMQTGGKQGVHTESLGHILSEMQYLQRAYPDAQW